MNATRRFWMLALCGALVGLAPRPAWALKNYAHTVTVTNNTGAAANDLHVNLIHPETSGKPTAPPFTTATPDVLGLQIDFSGATVANGGKSTVNWASKFASDTLDPTDPGHWTNNGNNIGNLAATDLAGNFIKPIYTPQSGGQVLVSLENTFSSDLAYSDLAIFTGANSSFFTPADYVGGRNTGSSVGLLVSTSGTLLAGQTVDIALFTPSSLPAFYDVGVVNIEGDQRAEGAQPVPEPSTLVLTTCAAVALLAVRSRRRWSGRLAARLGQRRIGSRAPA